MKVLDLDMDYFVNPVAAFVPENSNERLGDEEFIVWEKNKVVTFLEQNLKLSKNKKIKGRIVKNHNEVLYYWRDLIHSKKIDTPFEVIHVDSHADLGLGYASWAFIFEKLLGETVEDRDKIEEYAKNFDYKRKPGIGDFLLYALAFRWISKLTYICNPNEDGLDYLKYIMKNCDDYSGKIQLPFNKEYPATTLNNEWDVKKYLRTSILEPEVDFKIIRDIDEVNYNGDFDILTLSISPNYTPESADFIIDIIKDYIFEE